MTSEKTELVENVGGDYGVTVRYTLDPAHTAHVEFFAAEITGRMVDPDVPMYWREGATSSSDDTTDFSNAERYISGSVKWDGCSHLYFGGKDKSAYIHVCGSSDFTKMATVLPAIYERCGELMKEHGVNLLEGEFACWPKA